MSKKQNTTQRLAQQGERIRILLEQVDASAILAELGRVVTEYTVHAVPLYDGRAFWERDRDRGYCYWITYDLDLPTHRFSCSGTRPDNPFRDLKDAAIYALMGAMAATDNWLTEEDFDFTMEKVS